MTPLILAPDLHGRSEVLVTQCRARYGHNAQMYDLGAFYLVHTGHSQTRLYLSSTGEAWNKDWYDLPDTLPKAPDGAWVNLPRTLNPQAARSQYKHVRRRLQIEFERRALEVRGMMRQDTCLPLSMWRVMFGDRLSPYLEFGQKMVWQYWPGAAHTHCVAQNSVVVVGQTATPKRYGTLVRIDESYEVDRLLGSGGTAGYVDFHPLPWSSVRDSGCVHLPHPVNLERKDLDLVKKVHEDYKIIQPTPQLARKPYGYWPTDLTEQSLETWWVKARGVAGDSCYVLPDMSCTLESDFGWKRAGNYPSVMMQAPLPTHLTRAGYSIGVERRSVPLYGRAYTHYAVHQAPGWTPENQFQQLEFLRYMQFALEDLEVYVGGDPWRT